MDELQDILLRLYKWNANNNLCCKDNQLIVTISDGHISAQNVPTLQFELHGYDIEKARIRQYEKEQQKLNKKCKCNKTFYMPIYCFKEGYTKCPWCGEVYTYNPD